MTITKSKFTTEEDDFVLESSSNEINTKSLQNFNISTMNVRDVFVNQKKIEKERQAKKLIKLKNQIAMFNRLLEKKQQSTSSTMQKKIFIDIKMYDKNSQLYYDHDHFKYDSYVYEMKKIFKNNETLKKIKNSKEHKIVFSIS